MEGLSLMPLFVRFLVTYTRLLVSDIVNNPEYGVSGNDPHSSSLGVPSGTGPALTQSLGIEHREKLLPVFTVSSRDCMRLEGTVHTMHHTCLPRLS